MIAQVYKFPNAGKPRPTMQQERTDTAIIELGEKMDEMRAMLDRPHATDEYEHPLNKRGLLNTLWILACWNFINTVTIAILVMR